MHAAIGSSPFRRLQLRRFRSAVMLRILFFFIRGGGKLLEITIRLLPLGNQQERMLFDRFIITAKSTRKVTLLIGGLQGMLGALAFWIVGIEGPMLWGLIMVVTAIVPFGFSGFVPGPIIASLMQSVCHMYEQLYQDLDVLE